MGSTSAIRLKPCNVEALVAKGSAYLEIQDREEEETQQIFKEATDCAGPKARWDARYGRARAEARIGDTGQAVNYLADAYEENPSVRVLAVRDPDFDVLHGDARLAEKLFGNDLILAAKTFADVADSLEVEGNLWRPRELYDIAIRLDSDNGLHRQRSADLAFSDGDLNSAIGHLNEAIRLFTTATADPRLAEDPEPEHSDDLQRLGSAHKRLGNAYRLKAQRGSSEQAEKLYAMSLEQYNNAVAITMDDPYLYIGRGKLHIEGVRDRAAASKDFQRATSLAVGDTKSIPLFYLAWLENDLGNTADAVDHLETLLSEDPAYLRRVLSDPGFSGLVNNPAFTEIEVVPGSTEERMIDAGEKSGLGRDLTREGLLGEALAAYRLAAGLDRGNASHHFILGRALQAMGKDLAAADEYEKAVESDPNFSQAHCHLGLAFQADAVRDPATVRSHLEACERLTDDADIRRRAREALDLLAPIGAKN